MKQRTGIGTEGWISKFLEFCASELEVKSNFGKILRGFSMKNSGEEEGSHLWHSSSTGSRHDLSQKIHPEFFPAFPRIMWECGACPTLAEVMWKIGNLPHVALGRISLPFSKLKME